MKTSRKIVVALTAVSSLALANCTPDTQYSAMPETAGLTASSAEGLFGGGKRELANGRYGLALQSFKAALAKEPRSVRILNATGVTYDKLGRTDLAESYYRRALKIDPKSVQTMNNLGYCLLLQGKAQEALPFLRQAAQSGTKDGQSRIAADNYQLALARVRQATSSKIEKVSLTGNQETRSAPACTVAPVWLEKTGERVYTLITEPSAASAAALYQLSTASGAGNGVTGGAAPNCAVAVRDTYGVVPRLSAANAQENVKKPSPTLPALPDNVVSADQTGHANAKASAQAARADAQPVVYVSNGAGRDNLAARMRQYYESKGLQVDRITNAASFDHGATVIFYRKGFEKIAEQYAAALPTKPKTEQADAIPADVRVRLGRDILNFDTARLFDGNKKLSFLTESGI